MGWHAAGTRPVLPVYIVEDRPHELCCMVATEPALQLSPAEGSPYVIGSDSIIGIRRYITGETKRRLHQTAFRERVIDAYAGSCTLCRLRHRRLLDAAHIVPDGEDRGDPIVPNGLCLCKIHHAAYDNDLIGISPDYTMHVRHDVREESDGPMLLHGLQELHESRVALPNRRADRPDRDRLAWPVRTVPRGVRTVRSPRHHFSGPLPMSPRGGSLSAAETRPHSQG